MKKALKKKIIISIFIRILILLIGIGLVYALLEYGGVSDFYLDIFKFSLIFATAYAVCFSRNWTNWVYYGLLIGLVIYYIMYRDLTVNSIKFFSIGQALHASFIMIFIFEIYKILKKRGLFKYLTSLKSRIMR